MCLSAGEKRSNRLERASTQGNEKKKEKAKPLGGGPKAVGG